jgi:outer membrane protein OmpA-like peptidoglycan-associated protein
MKKNLLTIIAVAALLTTKVDAAKRIDNDNVKNAGRSNDNPIKAKAAKPAKRIYSMAELTKNLEYDFGKIVIRDGYYDKLDQLAKTMIDGKYAVALRGYADSIGTFKGNWVISDLRAKEVKTYLVKKGVDESKIVTTPFGSTKPIASNKTKAGRQKNRRVEIKLNDVAE